MENDQMTKYQLRQISSCAAVRRFKTDIPITPMISPISFISPLVHIPYGHLLYRPWYMWWAAAFTARKARDREDARLFSSPGGGTASAARKGLPFGLFPFRNKSYKCQIRLVLDLSKPLVSKALQTKCNLVSKNGFHLKIRKWSRLLCFPLT